MTVPPGLIITAILVVKILRDLENDRKGNKRTLAVFLGRGGTQIEYLLCIQIAYLIVPLAAWGDWSLGRPCWPGSRSRWRSNPVEAC
jgi:1,4-dihydroxy-2-naphthoate octaprenyltransferase